jgi:cbb3-type cytochrome oxidase subunit 3
VTYFLFAGDMLIMAFMVGLVIWVFMRSSKESMDEAAQIPLEDEEPGG